MLTSPARPMEKRRLPARQDVVDRWLKVPAAGADGTGDWLDAALGWLRWTILITMLLITIAWPDPGRTGEQLWVFVLIFGVYNLAVEVVRRQVPALRSLAWVPFVDLPVAAVLYFLDAEPGGPLFVAFFVAVVTAGITHSVRATALYTAVAATVVVAIAPTLPMWSPTSGELRQLSARLVVLFLVGVGASALTHRVITAQLAMRSMHNEAVRLEELDRLRGSFVATVSHDLRTPLTAVRAGLGLIETRVGGRLHPEEVDLFATARRNAERLGLLIDDLLAYNQIETGTFRLELVPLDARDAVTDAVSVVYPLLQEKHQTVELDLPEPLPVEGDPMRIEQVLVNLLANAHVHTPAGTTITITGSVNADNVQLVVRDDGPGIPPAELTEVFRRFHRAQSLGSGSGLGLAIAEGLVRLHGGRIWVESEPGQGAAFFVTLPRVTAGDAA